MEEEAMRLIESVVFDDNGGPYDLLTASHTFLTSDLAAHYGMPAPADPWGRVERDPLLGAGVLATGAVLAGQSLSDKSSPTQRGLLVHRRLMCHDVADPPPEIPAVDKPPEGVMTTREAWVQTHSGDSLCQTCHRHFDPMGFAFENFDELAVYRDNEFGLPIDATGELTGPDPVAVDGLAELAQEIAVDPRLADCVSGMMADWAFGGAGGEICLAETARDALSRGDLSFTEYFIALAGAPHFAERKPR
jgi:hypothetical protein